MTPERARVILCDPAPTMEAIKRAAAHMMLKCHPDTANDVTDLSMRDVKEARECLLSLLDGAKTPCKMCGGSGLIKWSTCRQCRGTGEEN